MRKPCAYRNHRDHAQRNFVFFAVGDTEYHVHAALGALAEFLVTKYNRNTDQGKSRNPVKRIGVAYRTDRQEHLPKESRKGSDKSAQGDCCNRQNRER